MNIQKLIDNYAHWLRSEITFEKIGEYYEITTPFLDNNNDYIQMYIRLDGDKVIFTDDGMTINNLEMNGFQLTSQRRRTLNDILTQYGVSLDKQELTTIANIHNFPQKKHLFLQAIMKIDDMFMTTRSKTTSYFLDDIQSYFEDNDIYYTENVQFIGTSGFSHNYEFLLQRSKSHPERLCRTLNNPNKSGMSNILFAWNDTKPSRRSDSQLIVFMNDSNSIAKGVEEAFTNYDAKVILWSERNDVNNINILSA